MTRRKIRKHVTASTPVPSIGPLPEKAPMSTMTMLRALEESPPETWFSVSLRSSVMIVGRVDDFPPGTGHKYILFSVRHDEARIQIAGEAWDVMCHGCQERDLMLLHLSPVMTYGDPGWLTDISQEMGDFLMEKLHDERALAGMRQLYPDGMIFEVLINANKVGVLGPQENLYGR